MRVDEGDNRARAERLGSPFRGLLIAVLVAAYGWFFHQPQASLSSAFLFAAGAQLAVVALRKFVPSTVLPQALDLFDLLADGATVLLFAVGVYGGILRMPDAV